VWRGGIALHDFVICGCCGVMLKIQDIIDDAETYNIHWDEAIVELEWIDISDIIKG
jgi:hypothetical protein